MPGRVSQYGSGRFLQSFFGLAAAPSAFYLALLKGLPSDTIDGATLGALEVSGGGYARQLYGSGSGSWSLVDSIGVVTSTQQVSFPTATADWGKITHYGLCTAATAGEIIISGSLNEDFYVSAGLTITIAAGLMAFEVASVNEPIIN